MSDDLVKHLRYCAPERRDCSRNELAMLDAADRIEQLEAALRDIADGTEEELTHDISSAALAGKNQT